MLLFPLLFFFFFFTFFFPLAVVVVVSMDWTGVNTTTASGDQTGPSTCPSVCLPHMVSLPLVNPTPGTASTGQAAHGDGPADAKTCFSLWTRYLVQSYEFFCRPCVVCSLVAMEERTACPCAALGVRTRMDGKNGCASSKSRAVIGIFHCVSFTICPVQSSPVRWVVGEGECEPQAATKRPWPALPARR
ncbi:uncharacterized protein IWZ02DRAFT_115395 [Phyllosticta citriasiana]|uniref:Secreted protein n=1 Tax=Phyllosticta citriasiana TaxID=595635 RepID=A0ABR1K9P7_9PEZI